MCCCFFPNNSPPLEPPRPPTPSTKNNLNPPPPPPTPQKTHLPHLYYPKTSWLWAYVPCVFAEVDSLGPLPYALFPDSVHIETERQACGHKRGVLRRQPRFSKQCLGLAPGILFRLVIMRLACAAVKSFFGLRVRRCV